MAFIGVRSSWDIDARNSDLRSVCSMNFADVEVTGVAEGDSVGELA